MGKGNVLKMYDSRAVFENLDTENCLVSMQTKDGMREFQVCDRSQLPDMTGPAQNISFEAIFGIYNLLSGAYVALVVESEPYVEVPTMLIRKAKKILVVPLFRSCRLSLSDSKQRDEDRFLELLHLSFSEHQFFFSTTFDVTHSQQRIALMSQTQHRESLWARADDRFFWNYEVVRDLIACQADQWIVPFMSAYIEVAQDCAIEAEKFTLVFISRRSRYRQGCRFTKRGIDENGNVANFVETEQILAFLDGRVSSYVQVRGSIPVRWVSPVSMKYEPRVLIDDNRNKSHDFAEKHFLDLKKRYSDITGNSNIICLNLVDMKKDQGLLGTAFKETCDILSGRLSMKLFYFWFDFHAECKQKGKWDNLAKLVKLADSQFRDQKYFCKQPNGQVTQWQVGAIRTNCMDNLDRTNVVQSLFARRSLMMQLGRTGDLDKYVLDTPWKVFEKTYKSVWVNNANAISLAYAGTGALKVDFTKTGKRTLKGMYNDGMNSCIRYYLNNFTDGVKQDAIDVLLGFYSPAEQMLSSSPFTARAGQESLANNITKAFVLMMVIFSTLLLLSPRFNLQALVMFVVGLVKGDTHSQDFVFTAAAPCNLTKHLLHSLLATLLVVLYLMFTVVKKGSKIGERMVVHPQLLPEPLSLPFPQ